VSTIIVAITGFYPFIVAHYLLLQLLSFSRGLSVTVHNGSLGHSVYIQHRQNSVSSDNLHTVRRTK